MLATGFIDNTMYTAKNRNATINNKILTEIHEKIMIWTKKHGFKFVIKKYQLIHFI